MSSASAARHAGDPNFFVQFGDSGREPARDAASGVVEQGTCTSRATSTPAEILDLYRRLRAAEPESEEFEALNAQFNRICNADPEAVALALRLEAHTA